MLVYVVNATEIHLNNLTPYTVKFYDGAASTNAARYEIKSGQLAIFDWADNQSAWIGTTDTDLSEVAITDSGITDVTVGWKSPEEIPLVVLNERQGTYMFFVEGFGFSFALMGWAFILRILKRSVTHTME